MYVQWLTAVKVRFHGPSAVNGSRWTARVIPYDRFPKMLRAPYDPEKSVQEQVVALAKRLLEEGKFDGRRLLGLVSDKDGYFVIFGSEYAQEVTHAIHPERTA